MSWLAILAYVIATIVAGVPIAYTVLYWTLHLKSRHDVRKAKDELRALPEMALYPEVLEAALADIDRAARADRKTTFYDWFAPFAVAIACIGLPESATRLPRWARKWDNNVSINGDGIAVFRDGQWLTLRDGIEALPGERTYTYDDLEFKGRAYYKFFGITFKPRTWFARWVWAGVRNRASQLSVDLGVDVSARPLLVSGDMNIHSSQEGHFLMQDGLHFHFKSVRKVRLIGRDWALIRSVGHKLELTKMRADDKLGRVAAVAIGWSMKGWKGK